MVTLPKFLNLFTPQLIAGLTLIWLVLWVGHWLPWPQFIGQKLPRVAAYVYGSTTILAAFTVWQWGNWPLIVGLIVLYFVAFVATWSAYKLDSIGVKISTQRRQNDNPDSRR